MDRVSGSRILLTGGTGSFGKRFLETTLERFDPRSITVYSRDEMKQWDLADRYRNEKRLNFAIGDVRDVRRLTEVSAGIDLMVHAAATKIVPTA